MNPPVSHAQPPSIAFGASLPASTPKNAKKSLEHLIKYIVDGIIVVSKTPHVIMKGALEAALMGQTQVQRWLSKVDVPRGHFQLDV